MKGESGKKCPPSTGSLAGLACYDWTDDQPIDGHYVKSIPIMKMCTDFLWNGKNINLKPLITIILLGDQ